ncbi:hypothetical protein [Bradyrhizobium sp. Leo121]|uniref:hypothetical protein n=1 Tax=Bradyrhizobium sp. Leo121 TaxID=1571195 RepID=UPI00102934C0|nr:hypothetical protein [Bradyrhizobium sp. Leo121]RZN24779.1 hypothetical protein CWO90_28485 [Bradyrhizobium sp. Leo121]
MPGFDDYALVLENAIDGFYGEDIELRPMITGSYLSQPIVDSSRAIVPARGVVVSKGAMLRSDSGFIAKRLESDLLLEVQPSYMAGIREGDRVLLKKTGGLFEISFIEPAHYGRPVLHLLTVKDNP